MVYFIITDMITNNLSQVAYAAPYGYVWLVPKISLIKKLAIAKQLMLLSMITTFFGRPVPTCQLYFIFLST